MKDKKAFLINITYYGFFAALIILAVKYILPVLMPFLLALYWFFWYVDLQIRSPKR